MYTLLLFTFAYLLHCQTADLRAKMVIHMARDAWYRKKNFRFYHCFGDEDGMKHLKCCLAKYFFCAQCALIFKSGRVTVFHTFLCAMCHMWARKGVARAAHPLHRSRWIMYMMKLRLISMKAKITKLRSLKWFFFLHRFVGLYFCQQWSWSGNLRLNRAVKKRLKRQQRR